MLLNVPVLLCKSFSTKYDGNSVMLDDPGRVRSQITRVVYQIQRFDFECNLVVTRKVIMGIPPVLDRNPRYGGCILACILNLVLVDLPRIQAYYSYSSMMHPRRPE